MSPTRPAAALRPASLPGLVLAVLAALFVLALAAAPARAHDSLVGSDPEDGAVLETSPEQIALTYSADILDVSPVVRITGADGEVAAEITPTVEGPVATAALEEPLAAGEYEVAWRVVSSDGHPIEGTFAITVEQDTATEPAAPSDAGGEAAPSDAGGDAAADQSAQEEPAESTDEAAASEDGSSSLPLLLGVVGLAVLAVAVAAFFTLRARR